MSIPHTSESLGKSFSSLKQEETYYDAIKMKCFLLINQNQAHQCIQFLKSIKENKTFDMSEVGLLYCEVSKRLHEKQYFNEILTLVGELKKEEVKPVVYSMLKGLVGNIYLSQKKFHLAITTLLDALENAPDNIIRNLHYDLGYCYFEMKDNQKSKEHYTLALEHSPPPELIIGIENQLYRLSVKGVIHKVLNFFR